MKIQLLLKVNTIVLCTDYPHYTSVGSYSAPHRLHQYNVSSGLYTKQYFYYVGQSLNTYSSDYYRWNYAFPIKLRLESWV